MVPVAPTREAAKGQLTVCG